MKFEIYCDGKKCGEGEVAQNGMNRLIEAFKNSGFCVSIVPHDTDGTSELFRVRDIEVAE